MPCTITNIPTPALLTCSDPGSSSQTHIIFHRPSQSSSILRAKRQEDITASRQSQTMIGNQALSTKPSQPLVSRPQEDVCMYTYLYIYMCVYVYIYMCVYIHISSLLMDAVQKAFNSGLGPVRDLVLWPPRSQLGGFLPRLPGFWRPEALSRRPDRNPEF